MNGLRPGMTWIPKDFGRDGIMVTSVQHDRVRWNYISPGKRKPTDEDSWSFLQRMLDQGYSPDPMHGVGVSALKRALDLIDLDRVASEMNKTLIESYKVFADAMTDFAVSTGDWTTSVSPFKFEGDDESS